MAGRGTAGLNSVAPLEVAAVAALKVLPIRIVGAARRFHGAGLATGRAFVMWCRFSWCTGYLGPNQRRLVAPLEVIARLAPETGASPHVATMLH